MSDKDQIRAWFDKCIEYGDIIIAMEKQLKDYRNLIDLIEEEITVTVEDDYYRQKLLIMIGVEMDSIKKRYHND